MQIRAALSDLQSTSQDRRSIRRTVRRARRALGGTERLAAEKAICRRISALGAYRHARTVAIFLAFDGEPSLAELIKTATRHGKRIHAPVIRGNHMTFAPVPNNALLTRNHFGIQEPAAEKFISTRSLDLVLAPLVAFDDHGTRLGIGRGYYDRALQFLVRQQNCLRPKLLGVAFSFQQLDRIERQAWDVPLWGAVTENNTFQFHNTST